MGAQSTEIQLYSISQTHIKKRHGVIAQRSDILLRCGGRYAWVVWWWSLAKVWTKRVFCGIWVSISWRSSGQSAKPITLNKIVISMGVVLETRYLSLGWPAIPRMTTCRWPRPFLTLISQNKCFWTEMRKLKWPICQMGCPNSSRPIL